MMLEWCLFLPILVLEVSADQIEEERRARRRERMGELFLGFRSLRSGHEFVNAAISHQGEKELSVLQQVRPEIWQVAYDEAIQ
jgi:hypothetical protein